HGRPGELGRGDRAPPSRGARAAPRARRAWAAAGDGDELGGGGRAPRKTDRGPAGRTPGRLLDGRAARVEPARATYAAHHTRYTDRRAPGPHQRVRSRRARDGRRTLDTPPRARGTAGVHRRVGAAPSLGEPGRAR